MKKLLKNQMKIENFSKEDIKNLSKTICNSIIYEISN
jgi:hypothetical protein